MVRLQKKTGHLQDSGQLIDLRQNQCSSLCHFPVPKQNVRRITAAALPLTCRDLFSCKTCKNNNVRDDLDETDECDMSDNDSDDGDERSDEPREEDLDDILEDW